MQHVHARDQAIDVVLLAEEANVFKDAQFVSQALGQPAVGAVSGHVQLGIDVFANFRKSLDAVEHAFHRPEVGNVYDAFAAAALRFRIGMVKQAVYEVVDDFDWVFDAEEVDGALAHVLADGSDAVRLLDRKLRDGEVRRICSHQRDVCSMQSSDKRQTACGGHLLRK